MANEKKRKAEPVKKGSPAKKQKVEPKTKQTGKPATKKTGKPATKQTGKPATKQTEKSATKQTGKPGTKQTGKTATGKPATKQNGKSATKQASKPATKQNGKPAKKEIVKQTKVVASKKKPVSKAKKLVVKINANGKSEKSANKKIVIPSSKIKKPSTQPKSAPKKDAKKDVVKKEEIKKPEKKTPETKGKQLMKPVQKPKEQAAAALAKTKLKTVKQVNNSRKNSKVSEASKVKKEESIPKQVKKIPAAKSTPEKPGKRKAEPEETEAPRKRRVITPNKKYADFETGVSPKKVSELRAFIQDKKKEPEDSTTSTENTPSKAKVTKPKETKAEEKGKSTEEPVKLTVIKPSEMKPAEKLLKKLQKKLEREARAASITKPENKVNKDQAKFKITKVVTYNKKPPLMAKAKALTKNLVAKHKAPILKAEKANALKSSILKEKPAAKPKTVTAKAKSGQASNGNSQEKGTPTKVSQAADKTKAKKIKELKREDRPIQTEFVSQKNVRFNDDPNQNCWITGIDVFPSGEIVLVDMGNKKIKLFTSEFQKSSQVKLDTIPQDLSISPIDASSAYFTKPFSKEGIQKLSMSDGRLTLRDSFFTNGTNRGITCTKAGILTSVQDGRYHDLDINCFKIDLLDYEGKILKSVSMDKSGARLFKLPLYFAVNSTGKQVIVSDCIRNNSYVISLDLTGKIAFKYIGVLNNMITPRGLTVDDEDNVYVTEWENHNVYVLSPTGKRLQILFNNTELMEQGLDGLAKPYQLCYQKQENGGRLIVSQEGCNTIKVFRVFKKPAAEEATGKAEESKKGADAGKAETEADAGKVETDGDAGKAEEKSEDKAENKEEEKAEGVADAVLSSSDALES